VDRFDPKRTTTLEHVSRGMVGNNLTQATLLEFQKKVEQDKCNVTMVARGAIRSLMQQAADICGMTYMSPLTNTRMQCVTSRDIRSSWLADGGPANQKRFAWMYFYYPTVVYNMVLNETHQAVVEKETLKRLQVVYSNQEAMSLTQKTCVQQMYARLFNENRANVLRSACREKHQIQVSVTIPKNKRATSKKREKPKFYISDVGAGEVQEVSKKVWSYASLSP
jgi:hypothetical protein